MNRRRRTRKDRIRQLRIRLAILLGLVAALIIALVILITSVMGQNRQNTDTQTAAVSASSVTAVSESVDEEAERAAQEAARKLAEEKAAQEAEAEKKAEEEKKAAEEAARLEEEKRLAEEEAARQAEEAAKIDDGTGTTIRICMVGDLLLHDAINSTAARADGTYDYNSLFTNITAELQNYDLRIINEETPCGGPQFGISGYPSFNGPYEAIDAVANAGFNCVTMATNHMLASTLQYWRTYYPYVGLVGAYDSFEASEQIYVYQKDDFRVAVLNYTYGSNAGAEILGSSDMYWAVNLLEETSVYYDIQRAKEVADYVIVCPHWGTEYNIGVDELQIYWTDRFLEWGVDLVIGTHPHVIEPMDYRTYGEDHGMLIYYSLGNFVSNQDNAYSMVGGMADVTIRKNSSGVHLDDFGAKTVITHKALPFTTYMLRDYSPELAPFNMVTLTDPSFSYEYCVNLSQSIYGDCLKW